MGNYHQTYLELGIRKRIEPNSSSLREGAIKKLYSHHQYSDEELQAELDEAMEEYLSERELYDSATDHGFSKGVLLHTDTYNTIEVFVKVKKVHAGQEATRALPLEKRKMAECTPEEQILKIHTRENRKKEIDNNKFFEEVVHMVRQMDYISMDKPLSMDEMAAFAISLYENNIGYYEREHFQGFFEDTENLSGEEIVDYFRKNFKVKKFQQAYPVLADQTGPFRRK